MEYVPFLVLIVFYCLLAVPFVGFLIEDDFYGEADCLPIGHYYKIGAMAHIAVLIMSGGVYSVYLLAPTT